MGRDLSRIVRDLPIEIDLEAARLGDYDRDTVVRLFREYEFRTLIERLPPMAGESAEERTRACGRVAESGYVPAARVAGRPEGWGAGRRSAGADGERRAPAAPRLRHGRRGGRRRDGGARRDAGHDRKAARTRVEPAGDLPTALAAAIVDPGRIEVRGADRIAELGRWIAAQPAVGVVARCSTIRDRAAARRSRSRSPGADGRVVAADGAEAADAPAAPRRRRPACRSSGTR